MEWIESELVRHLMAEAGNLQWVNVALVALVAGLLFNWVPWPWLTLWTACSLALSVYRLIGIRHYAHNLQEASPARVRHFMRRFGWSWAVSGMLWGSTAAMFFERAPVPLQFLCWLILAGIGTFATTALSCRHATSSEHLNAMSVTILAVLLFKIAVLDGFAPSGFHLWLLGFFLLYWMLLLRNGGRLSSMHRNSFELQYRNGQLIDSLRSQTLAALDAVETKNRFIASAAHDIRQPVHALALYADWLRSEPELVDEIAPKIVESARAVNALFDSLFDLARLDAGKTSVHIEPLDLDRLLQDVELQNRPLAEARGLSFRMRIQKCRVQSDAIALQRIIGNLVANAVRYTERGGLLLAIRRRRNGTVRVEIYDTGVGIAPENQEAVFREFFKVPMHDGTEDGFGLGLAIVSRLTAVLGHDLQMVSRLGRGTRFRLTLSDADTRFAAERAAAATRRTAELTRGFLHSVPVSGNSVW